MHISWLGGTAIKIQTKPFEKDVVIVIDPYKPAEGSFPRSLAAHVGLYTRSEKNSVTLSGAPFVLSTPGEIETEGVLVSAAPGESAEHIVIRVDAEGMSVGHLGLMKKQPSNEQLSILSGVDILFVPIGGVESFDAEAAVKAVNAIEPRVVIPMAFKSDNDPVAATVDTFLREMGASSETPEKKVILKKKDLPVEETKVVVLAKE